MMEKERCEKEIQKYKWKKDGAMWGGCVRERDEMCRQMKSNEVKGQLSGMRAGDDSER